MHTRAAIAGRLARYAAAILISCSIHWFLFHSQWAPRSANTPALVQLQQGMHAVELTLISSTASHATEPKHTQPEPKPEPKPEPIKEIPLEPATKIAQPEPPPEQEVLESEAPVEPAEPTAEPAPEPERAAIDSAEQTGSLQTKGVNAKSTSIITPVYPRRSNLLREEGTVLLNARIAVSGKLLHVEVTKTSGFHRLDEAALKAVRAASFTPAIKDGHPVEEMISLAFKFELN